MGGWGGHYGNLDDAVEAARAELNLAAGGSGEAYSGQVFPEGERLGANHVAIMLDWVLSQQEEDDETLDNEP